MEAVRYIRQQVVISGEVEGEGERKLSVHGGIAKLLNHRMREICERNADRGWGLHSFSYVIEGTVGSIIIVMQRYWTGVPLKEEERLIVEFEDENDELEEEEEE